jgi:hypothetical protein
VKLLENRVVRKILGTKTDEVTGEWRRLRNEELYDLYSGPNITRMMKWSKVCGHVARKVGGGEVMQVLVWET